MKQLTNDRDLLIRNFAITGDFLLLNGLMLLIYYIMSHMNALTVASIDMQRYLVLANLCYVPSVSMFKVVLHNRIVHPEKIIARLLGLVTMHALLFLAVGSIMKDLHISRLFIFVFFTSFFIMLTVWRLALRQLVKHHRSKGRNLRTVVLIGDGDNLAELSEELSRITYGYKIVRTFRESETQEMLEWLKTHPVRELYCSISTSHQQEVFSIIHFCENNMIRFYSVPSMRSYLKRHLELTLVGDIPVLSLGRDPLQKSMNRFFKRAFDFSVSLVFLLTFFPIIFLVVGIIIKITSPGPIFFRQARTGENGREFMCFKFRSMKVNKDSDRVQATKNDPRKTKFGNFLRKSNIDELPQMINVLMGDMSLVGPRPHMLKHTEEYSRLIDKYMMRHLTKPGITGWAQVTGYRGETKELSQMEGRVKRDIWYIENWSFLLDIRILIMTVTNMFHGEKNAY